MYEDSVCAADGQCYLFLNFFLFISIIKNIKNLTVLMSFLVSTKFALENMTEEKTRARVTLAVLSFVSMTITNRFSRALCRGVMVALGQVFQEFTLNSHNILTG